MVSFMTNATTQSALATEVATNCLNLSNDKNVLYDSLKSTPITSVEQAAELAVAMAQTKASAQVYRKFASIAKWLIEAEMTEDQIRLGMMSELVDLATEDADDRYLFCGRGNDLARSANDARLKPIGRIQSMINAR